MDNIIKIETRCEFCGWPNIHLCCNDTLGITEPYASFDYWVYCSSPVCKNHKGDGYYSCGSFPDWVNS